MRVRHFNLCGGRHPVAVPIGFLEDVARIEPRLWQLYRRICRGEGGVSDATLGEVRGVVEAALRHGGARIGVREIAEYEGIERLWTLAAEVIELAIAMPDDLPEDALPGKPAAATETGASPSPQA